MEVVGRRWRWLVGGGRRVGRERRREEGAPAAAFREVGWTRSVAAPRARAPAWRSARRSDFSCLEPSSSARPPRSCARGQPPCRRACESGGGEGCRSCRLRRGAGARGRVRARPRLRPRRRRRALPCVRGGPTIFELLCRSPLRLLPHLPPGHRRRRPACAGWGTAAPGRGPGSPRRRRGRVHPPNARGVQAAAKPPYYTNKKSYIFGLN